MRKIVKSKGVLMPFILKSIIINIVSSVVMLLIFSTLIYKLDLGDEYYKIFAFVSVGITSFLTSLIAVKGYKNNILVMSILSNIILIVISVVNSIINADGISLLINIVITVLCSFLTSIINSKSTSKFKV